jgi:DNA-binding GntR family transcriptional regulator
MVVTESHRGSRVTEASHGELADLMETRRAIERLCLTQAMQRGDAAWEAEIVAAMHLLSRTPLPASSDDRDAAAAWEMQHRRFHHALVAACGSAWLLRFWGTLADHSERYRKIRLLQHRRAEALVRDVNAEHVAIMEAVIARDEIRAIALMDAHLHATEQGVSPFLDPGPAPQPDTRR